MKNHSHVQLGQLSIWLFVLPASSSLVLSPAARAGELALAPWLSSGDIIRNGILTRTQTIEYAVRRTRFSSGILVAQVAYGFACQKAGHPRRIAVTRPDRDTRHPAGTRPTVPWQETPLT